MGFGYHFAYPKPPICKAFFPLRHELLPPTLAEAGKPHLPTKRTPYQEVVDPFLALLT
jgi:hypothetical protein